MRRISLFSTALWLGAVAAAGCSSTKEGKLAQTPEKPSIFARSSSESAPPASSFSTKQTQVAQKPASGTNPKMDVQVHLQLAARQKAEGQFPAAELQYKTALEKEPKNLQALLGYAHLLDLQGKVAEATPYYEAAVQHHPGHASAHNDLGLCYARRGMHVESERALARAIELQPQKVLYRNNLATVLVEQQKHELALQHLKAVHPTAVAHYNLGFLMQHQGHNAMAIQQFQTAARMDPSLESARQWLAKLTPVQQPQVANLPAVESNGTPSWAATQLNQYPRVDAAIESVESSELSRYQAQPLPEIQ